MLVGARQEIFQADCRVPTTVPDLPRRDLTPGRAAHQTLSQSTHAASCPRLISFFTKKLLPRIPTKNALPREHHNESLANELFGGLSIGVCYGCPREHI